MTNDRWLALDAGTDDHGPHLTLAEIAEGWHFCCDFDGLLVGPGMSEVEYCTCDLL